jgi:BCCT family betaine/carnitine transporter
MRIVSIQERKANGADSSYTPVLDRRVFFTSIGAVVVVSLLMILFPDASAGVAQVAMVFVTEKFGWMFLLAGAMPLVFAGWLAFGRFRDVKFGRADEKPEYSTLSWVAMMFTASMGGSLIALGFAEPIFYLQSPPLGIEANSSMAFEFAHMYPIYHWSLVPWAIYCLPAIPIAYMVYVRRAHSLRISDACDGALPDRIKAPVKPIIDILIVISIVGGVATSIGLGAPLAAALAVELFGVPDNLLTQIAVIVLWTAIFGTSAYLGLRRGIRLLADINIFLILFFLAFVLLLGPTVYILSISVNSLGLLADNFARISFWTDPIDRGGFPETWTIFYWAWWFAYSPMMGLFFARISRGRTIRQTVIGIIGLGSLGTFLFLSIAGAYVLHLQGSGLLDAVELLNARGMATLVAVVIGHLPAPTFVLAVVTILTIIFYATTFDSAAYVLASICTKDLPGDEEPGRINRVAWAIGLALIATSLLIAGGLETVKSLTVVTSLSALPVLFMMCYTLYRWLHHDFPALAKPVVHK